MYCLIAGISDFSRSQERKRKTNEAYGGGTSAPKAQRSCLSQQGKCWTLQPPSSILSPVNAPRRNGSLIQTAIRFIRFCLVGASGVLVDMGVLFLLADSKMLGWALTPSKICAAETAIVNNFMWNELWTFRDISASQASWQSRAIRFLKFNLICLAGV